MQAMEIEKNNETMLIPKNIHTILSYNKCYAKNDDFYTELLL